MTPERWRQLERLLHEAVGRPGSELDAFLHDACAGDDALRQDLLSLMAAHTSELGFLEASAFDAPSAQRADIPDALVGTSIGAYHIESRLGVGGMGEVYLAVDTTLDRKVAIKFLPKQLQGNELARRRQIREAKAAAALDHPNICGIYEVATQELHSFIVMQYVEGETLASRLRRLPMGLDESVDVAIQIADALSAAHALALVHRDIKPLNIMITPRGQVKVLDFGLAKRPTADMSTTIGGTRPGVIVGTPQYMSPEQAKGDELDSRTDLFSLGALLYECVTGRPAFKGETAIETCAQVIHVDPPLPSSVNPAISPALDQIILKALAKDRHLRHSSAAALRDALIDVRAGRDAAERAAVRPWRRRTVLAGLAVLTLVSTIVLGRQWTAPYRPGPEAVQWYERGTAALNDGTYYKAGKALEQAVAFDDRFALGHARLAEAWAELDYGEKASREILRAQSLARESPVSDLDSLRVQAITHVVLREFDKAITAYEHLTQLVPAAEKAGAYVDLGRAQEQDDRIKEAEESYTRATTLATQDPAAYLRLGILRGRQQDLEGAARALQTAEKLYQALSNVEGEAEVCYQRAFLSKNLNRLHDARVQAEQALTLSSRPDNPFQRIRTLLVLSGVAAAEGRPSEAEAQATRAIELARTNGMENQATNGLVWLGNLFLSRGDYSQAEVQYTRALELARRDNGRLNEAVALFSLGSLRSQQRKTDDALRLVQEALPFFQRAGHRKWLAVALTLLGRVHRDRGEYDAALQAFNEQLTIGARVGDASQEAVLHTEIGSVLKRQERYPEALEHFEKSAIISVSLNATVSVGYALMERAGVLWQLGRFDEAKSALDQATANAGPEGVYKGLLAEIHLARARVYLGAGQFQASKVESQRAIDMAADQYSDIATEATVTLGLAETRSGNARAAVRATQKTVTTATDTGDPLLLSSARLALAEALLSVGDTKSALETARLAQESFGRFGQLDSEWRAWLLEAESARRMGQVAGARECATAATARLASLEQRLGPDPFAGFATRPDVMEFRRRLHQQLNP